MRAWIRVAVFVVAVLALGLVVLPLQAAPAEAPEGSAWTLELPQFLVSWVGELLGLDAPDRPGLPEAGPTPETMTNASTDPNTNCAPPGTGEGGPGCDPNG